jgi:hypothetical protein
MVSSSPLVTLFCIGISCVGVLIGLLVHPLRFVGGLQGSLSSLKAPQLGAIAIKAALER